MNDFTLGIRQRVLIITLLPLLMITFLLGSYFIKTRIDDAHDSLLEKGRTISRMMASSAEFGLLTGNDEILSGLIRAAMRGDNEVVDIIFLDPEFNTITRGTSQLPLPENKAIYPFRKEGHIYFLEKVLTTGVDFSDNPDLLSSGEYDPDIIGQVVIVLSLDPTQQRQLEILIKGILLAFTGLLITFMVATRFGSRITNPILGLTQVVKLLQEGKLETRASTSSTGELRSLAEGINRLAHRVQESNQSLESQVEKATKRLRKTLIHLEQQNQALDRAKKRADKANLAKDEFLARMSHELRTPLTSVSGFSRLLDQTDLHGEQKEYTRIINLTSGLLLSIIDDILDYSKLESNAIVLEEIPFDFENAVLDVLEMQTALANDKGVELISIISPNTPRNLVGDPVRLKQIISNLVSNAVKFTDSGHVAVIVETIDTEHNQRELAIHVQDTGPGIPESQLHNLFKAFSQADNSISRRYGGSGLGLVIAKRLTELMRGSITLASESGHGTTITLELPYKLADRVFEQPTLDGQKVIFFDPHPLVRESIENQLQSLGAQAIVAQEHQRFLGLIEENPQIPVFFGLSPDDISPDTLHTIQHILETSQAKLLVSSPKPVPVTSHPRLTQLRKPSRSRLLFNALSQTIVVKDAGVNKASVKALKQSVHVLVAEDNDFNRLLIRRILESAGCKVSDVVNGQDAVQSAVKQTPDIILMDVHMPIMDGIEATKVIRLANKETPIIALTANVVSSEHQKLIAAGVDCILLKPINDTELCLTIEQFMAGEIPTPTLPPGNGGGLELAKYNIESSALTQELKRQLSDILEGFRTRDIGKMRHHCHQLIGLAGLYDIPEIEVSGHNLHDALIKEEMKSIWKSLWQLRRLIEGEEYLLSEEL